LRGDADAVGVVPGVEVALRPPLQLKTPRPARRERDGRARGRSKQSGRTKVAVVIADRTCARRPSGSGNGSTVSKKQASKRTRAGGSGRIVFDVDRETAVGHTLSATPRNS
jgi:hypothetical protein